MRVLHVAKVSGMGGTERMLLALLPYLRSAGIDVHMLVLASDDADRFVTPLHAAGVPTLSIPFRRDFSTTVMPRLLRTIRSVSPDIVHTHLLHADLYGQLAARLLRIPGVITMHSVVPFFAREPYRSLARAAHANAFATVATSHHVADFLTTVHIATESKIEVIWHGVEPDAWRTRTENRAEARVSQGIPADAFAIGMTSRMIDGKGHEVLLSAFERMGGESDVHLVLAGDGARFESVSAQARRSAYADRIHFLGYCGDIRNALATLDVAVVPTTPDLDEGFGLVALEAMAFGLPVVASRLGALGEVVVDGVTGILVPASDDVSLAQALLELRNSPSLRASMGTAAVDRTSTHFSLAAAAQKTMAVYAKSP